MREPLIHSDIEAELPAVHPLAHDTINCATCGNMLHHCINENMRTWVETGKGNYCLRCFAALPDVEAIGEEDGYGLSDQP